MIWTAFRTPIAGGETVRIAEFGRLRSADEVITKWSEDGGFRAFSIEQLAAAPHPAFFWEMPPIRREALGWTFEFTTIGSDALRRVRADPFAFRGQLQDPATVALVVAFRNLSGDALLVVPRQLGESSAYGHVGVFFRRAPIEQRHALLQSLAGEIRTILRDADRPLWVSTAGMGVPWLHVRLDKFPKYYNHAPYRDPHWKSQGSHR